MDKILYLKRTKNHVFPRAKYLFLLMTRLPDISSYANTQLYLFASMLKTRLRCSDLQMFTSKF